MNGSSDITERHERYELVADDIEERYERYELVADDIAEEAMAGDDEFALEDTVPGDKSPYIELVEEIPTGHETRESLEVTTIEVEQALDALELVLELPMAPPGSSPGRHAPHAEVTRVPVKRVGKELMVAAGQVAALLERVSARVALALDHGMLELSAPDHAPTHAIDPDDPVGCTCSCHAHRTPRR
jgi:hypothetical protein